MPKIPKEIIGTQFQTGPKGKVEMPKSVLQVCKQADEEQKKVTKKGK